MFMPRFFSFAIASAALVVLTGYSLADDLGLFSEHSDVGVTPQKGTAEYDSAKKEYKVTGGGANIWAQTDAFQFVYKQISGDATLSADVHFEGQGTEQHRKAALMFRQTLAPDAAYADVALHGDGLTSLQYRPVAGANTLEMRSAEKAPVHLTIERHADQFTISVGPVDGPMQKTGPMTIALTDPLFVGLAVCSHNAEVLETAVFSNVQITTRAAQNKRLELLVPVSN